MYSHLFTHPFSFFLSAQLFFLLCLLSSARQNKQSNTTGPLIIAVQKSLSKSHCIRQKKKNTHWGALLTAHRHRSHLCSSIICNFSFIFLSLSSASLRSFKTLSFSRRRLSSAARLLSSSFLSSSSRWHTHTHTRDKGGICHAFVRQNPALFSSLLNLSDSKHPAEIHFSLSKCGQI